MSKTFRPDRSVHEHDPGERQAYQYGDALFNPQEGWTAQDVKLALDAVSVQYGPDTAKVICDQCGIERMKQGFYIPPHLFGKVIAQCALAGIVGP